MSCTGSSSELLIQFSPENSSWIFNSHSLYHLPEKSSTDRFNPPQVSYNPMISAKSNPAFFSNCHIATKKRSQQSLQKVTSGTFAEYAKSWKNTLFILRPRLISGCHGLYLSAVFPYYLNQSISLLEDVPNGLFLMTRMLIKGDQDEVHMRMSWPHFFGLKQLLSATERGITP